MNMSGVLDEMGDMMEGNVLKTNYRVAGVSDFTQNIVSFNQQYIGQDWCHDERQEVIDIVFIIAVV